MTIDEITSRGAYIVSGSIEAPGGLILGKCFSDGTFALNPEGDAWMGATAPAPAPAPAPTRGRRSAPQEIPTED